MVASSSGGHDIDKDVKNNDTFGNASNRHDVPLKQPQYPLSHLFSVAVCALEAIGFIGFILLVVWLAQYHGGFAWDGSKREFNYHAVFMFLGIVFFYSNGKLIFPEKIINFYFFIYPMNDRAVLNTCGVRGI